MDGRSPPQNHLPQQAPKTLAGECSPFEGLSTVHREGVHSRLQHSPQLSP